jgi:hypothetical protein
VIFVSDHIFSHLNDENYQEAFLILTSIVSIGDGMRRCVVLGIYKYFDDFIQRISFNSGSFNQSLVNFLGSLANDNLYRLEFSKSFFSHSIQLLTLHQKSILNDFSLSSLQPFNTILFQYFYFEVFHQLEAVESIDLAQIFAELTFICHSIVFNFFDTSTSSYMREIYNYSQLDQYLIFFQKYKNASICQRFFVFIFDKEIELEGGCPRNPLLLTVDNSNTPSFLFLKDKLPAQKDQSNYIQISLSSRFQSASGAIEKIFSPDNSDLSIFDGAPISFHLFIHSNLPFLLLPHSENMKYILLDATRENNFKFDEFLIFFILSLRVYLYSILYQSN